MYPTISEVAAEAGVGRASAARALGEYGSVSPAMRKRVEEAARRLGYRPNSLARSMSTGVTKTLGVVVADISNPFFATLARGVADAVSAAEIDTLVVNTDESVAREQAVVEALVAKQVDGIVVATASRVGQDAPHLRAALTRRVPVVLVDRNVEGIELDAVLLDNRTAAREAVHELVLQGHRRIGLVWGPYLADARLPHTHEERTSVLSTTWERYLGYRDGLEAAGIDLDEDLVAAMPPGPRELAMGACHALMSLQDAPTALVTTESDGALGVLLELREAGLRCPQDVSVVGIDDAPWAVVSAPPLTVYRQPAYDMGRRAAELILQRLDDPRRPVVVERLAGELIRRESVAAAGSTTRRA